MKRLILAAIMVLVSMVGMVGVSSVTAQPATPLLQKLQEIQQSLDSLQSALDELPPTWSKILPAQDRFVMVMNNEAVLDKETGLVWERSPDISNFNWLAAQIHCNQLTLGNRKGWRLPTVQELASLVDPSVPTDLILPAGHPFDTDCSTGGCVQSTAYWSATTFADDTSHAWGVGFYSGNVVHGPKSFGAPPVWCVRGGQGVDPQ